MNIRYNRRADVLKFIYDGLAQFTRIILHIFIWGHDWIAQFKSDAINWRHSQNLLVRKLEIVVAIYKVFRHQNATTHAYKIIESHQKIPSGIGHWVVFEIDHLYFYWAKNLNIDQFVIVRGRDAWMRYILSTGITNINRPLVTILAI